MTTRHHLLVAGLGGALALGFAGCKNDASTTAPIVSSSDNGQDPAAGNVAQPYTGGSTGGYSGQPAAPKTRVLSSSQSYSPQANGETYGYDQQTPAPVVRQTPSDAGQGAYDQGYSDAEEAGEEAIAATDQAPPPLPDYDQPPAPEPNDLWTPGYWNYAQTGYYWVPGAWVAPPFYGALWTPPYWGWGSNRWMFHRGYWGSHVGFYGGVNYGFGYVGTGYYGGYWHGRDFVYNQAVTNVNSNIVHNVYTHPVIVDGRQYGPRPLDRVSYNGGRGGISVQPTPGEIVAAHEAHYPPVAAQRDLRLQAAANRSQSFTANGGHPAVAFANRPVGNVQLIAAAPREQPFNRTGVTAPGAGPNRSTPNASSLGPARSGFNPAQPGLTQGRTAAPPAQQRSIPQAQHAAEAAPHSPAPASRPSPSIVRPTAPVQRPGTVQERPAAPVQRPAAPVQRPAAPVQRAPAPAYRPEPTGPAQTSRPAVAPAARPAAPARAVPAPRTEPAPHGGGEHGGHR